MAENQYPVPLEVHRASSRYGERRARMGKFQWWHGLAICVMAGMLVGGVIALKPHPHAPMNLKFRVRGVVQPVVLDLDPKNPNPREVYEKLRLAGFTPTQIHSNYLWRHRLASQQTCQIASLEQEIARTRTRLAQKEAHLAKTRQLKQGNAKIRDLLKQVYASSGGHAPVEVANRP